MKSKEDGNAVWRAFPVNVQTILICAALFIFLWHIFYFLSIRFLFCFYIFIYVPIYLLIFIVVPYFFFLFPSRIFMVK